MEQNHELNAKLFDAILNHLNFGIIGVDSEGYVRIFNTAAEKLLCLEAEEAIGRLSAYIIPEPEERPREWTIEYVGRRLKINRIILTEYFESVRLLYSITAISKDAVVETTHDNKRNLHLWHAIYDNFPDPACFLSIQGRVMAENPAWQQLNGGNTLNEYLHTIRETGKKLNLSQLAGKKEPVRTAARYKNNLGLELIVPRIEKDESLSGYMVWINPLETVRAIYNELLECHLAQQIQDMEDSLVCRSNAMEKVVDMVGKIASADATVLITGETGVGKGLIAKKIHAISRRRDFPYIRINCGAIPENLIESELFGYEGGAFTGARNQGKKGLFEQGNHGIIFLDEIGELPIDMQVKLLHVLDEYQITRVGGNRVINLDIRIICATNRNLEQLVAEKKFREDLYYRLNIIQLHIPPLRERKEDIPALIDSFLKRYCLKYHRAVTISPEDLAGLWHYHWPGNVRQLENWVERFVVLGGADKLETPFAKSPSAQKEKVVYELPGLPAKQAQSLGEKIQEFERKLILDALHATGSTYKAAIQLGVNQSTVSRKARQLGIKINEKIVKGKAQETF